jgi:kynurenine 3-monooxygenase
MCALLLGRRGLPLLLLEQRSDFRRVTQEDNDRGRIENSTKRSINLALSYRGISALKRCGLFAQVEPLLIPMKGRYMHNVGTDKLTFQPYGKGDQVYTHE